MLTVLLIIIYIAFISLGLPDAILGSAWPMIYQDLNVPISSAGICTMIISGGTIVSSFFSEKLIRRFGTGKVTAVSVSLTAMGLLGIYFSPNFLWICLLGIPLGLGAGAVDAALNNFIALHYEAKHMNWLHCFWGVGATAGPFIMSMYLLKDNGWRMGYATIGIFQVILVFCLILSLPLWKRFESDTEKDEEVKVDTNIKSLLKIKGVKPAFVAFFCYCAVETTTGVWASSYLVMGKGLTEVQAAKWVSLFYLGITVGRFLAGFLAMRFNNRNMIRLGLGTCLCGAVALLMPFSTYFQLIGLVLVGLGCAPVYPAMLHETPNRFGQEISQGIMGVQMSVAYVGATFMPPLFGVIAKAATFNLLPYLIFVLTIVMLVTSEQVASICLNRKSLNE